ncbi:MAG: TetR/AcrR family transcriptional regulator [Pseudomonadota bacterium]
MKASERRAETREALVHAAEARIAEEGLSGLKARALATEVGISVGAIYTYFADLDALALEVNARTFHALGAFVTEAVAAEQGGPERQLVAMGLAYARFAAEKPRRWRAIFDIELTEDQPPPEWYMDEIRALFRIIAQPLGTLRTDLGPEDVLLLTRALFASVHGIVRLSVEGRVSAVPAADMPRVIELLISSTTRPAPDATSP